MLRAARQIVEKGGHPSVADVADLAGISRATAYRYFSTPDEIIREAVLDGVADVISIEPAAAGAGLKDAEVRLDKLVSDIFHMILNNESVFRALLGNAVTGQTQVRRGGRRIPWLKEALSPLQGRVPSKQLDKLIHALSLVTGVESLVVMRDICELEPKEAERILRWTAKAILKTALAENNLETA